MKCKNFSEKGLDEKQRKILKALAATPETCGTKDIAGTTGMEAKQVSCHITSLKKKGYIESPVRCKYTITQEGKAALA